MSSATANTRRPKGKGKVREAIWSTARAAQRGDIRRRRRAAAVASAVVAVVLRVASPVSSLLTSCPVVTSEAVVLTVSIRLSCQPKAVARLHPPLSLIIKKHLWKGALYSLYLLTQVGVHFRTFSTQCKLLSKCFNFCYSKENAHSKF